MKSIEISGLLRKGIGKTDSKRLRKSENVPCVVYGGEEIVHFYAHRNEFRHIIYTSDVYIVNLDIEGKKIKTTIKDIQFHPVTDEVMHIDFIEIADNKPVTINLPVRLNGVAPGIKAGGKTRFKSRTLKVKGIVDHIPECINVDISSLQIKDAIKVENINVDGITLLDQPSQLIVKIVTARGAQQDLEEGEEGEVEEGEEKSPEAGSEEKGSGE